jgi:hypothetical protein
MQTRDERLPEMQKRGLNGGENGTMQTRENGLSAGKVGLNRRPKGHTL